MAAPSEPAELTLRVRAEAAAWLAMLGGPQRSARLEAHFARWLANDPPHRVAWERVTDAWDLCGGLAGHDIPRADAEEHVRYGRKLLLVVSVLTVAAVTAGLRTWMDHRGLVSTGVGERRVVSLKDGSRVTLNTRTRLIVRYDSQARRVRIERGEALFDVKRDPGWPFVVTAGRHEVVAHGTAFEVRRNGIKTVAITLVEGRLSVAPADAGVRPPPGETTVLASPGQRLTFKPHRVPRLDRPALEQVMAWQSGAVVFDHTRLAQAVREMNRYSAQRIVLRGPRVARLEVSGLFQAGASMDFAVAVAGTYGLHVHCAGRGRTIILQRRPILDPASP